MKKFKQITMSLLLILSISAIAQKSSNFNGTYRMKGGSQRMEIITEGGAYYHVKFTGDCNSSTKTGRVDDGNLVIPMSSGFIMIQRRGDKLDVNVKNEKRMREVCGGSSIVGTYYLINNTNYNNSRYNENYTSHKHYSNDKFNNSYTTRDSRGYGSVANVYDLVKTDAKSAYRKLEDRGFFLIKTTKGKSKTYRVWYNHETNQCIKTVSIQKRIHEILKSTHCGAY